jgi:hypothetical protein
VMIVSGVPVRSVVLMGFADPELIPVNRFFATKRVIPACQSVSLMETVMMRSGATGARDV